MLFGTKSEKHKSYDSDIIPGDIIDVTCEELKSGNPETSVEETLKKKKKNNVLNINIFMRLLSSLLNSDNTLLLQCPDTLQNNVQVQSYLCHLHPESLKLPVDYYTK